MERKVLALKWIAQRITCQSYADLAVYKIKVPYFQRPLNNGHVKALREQIERDVAAECEPPMNSLSLCINHEDGNHYVVDGQHRLKAYEEDYAQYQRDIPIHLLIYPVADTGQMEERFRSLNKNMEQPAYILELPKGDSKRNKPNQKVDTKSVLKEIHAWVDEQPLNRPASGTPRPFINTAKFMNKFTKSKLGKEIKDLKAFQEAWDVANETIRDLCEDPKYRKKQGISDIQLGKAEAEGTYVGLLKEFSWLDGIY